MNQLPPVSVVLSDLLDKGQGNINVIRNALKWAGTQHPRAKGVVKPDHYWDHDEILKITRLSIDNKRKTAGVMWLEYALPGVDVNQGVNLIPDRALR